MPRKIMIITTDDDIVEIDEACPHCGERRVDHLANRDGQVHCATCGHDYDLEPEREATNA